MRGNTKRFKNNEQNRTNQILFDFTCIVGIDFDDEKFHDEN